MRFNVLGITIYAIMYYNFKYVSSLDISVLFTFRLLQHTLIVNDSYYIPALKIYEKFIIISIQIQKKTVLIPQGKSPKTGLLTICHEDLYES